MPVSQLQTVAVSHRTSRAGDPHWHIYFQIGTRVWAAGKWRALDTAALFKQQGAIRALGTAVIAAHPELAEVLDRHGLTLGPVSGEVVELERFNGVMSKRGEQVRRHLERLEAEWEAAHPGEAMGPVVSARLAAKAWAYERPAKKPTTLREEAAWLAELRDAGYDPGTLPHPATPAPMSLDDLSVREVASRALDRCAAGASAWTTHTVQEHATRIMTEFGVRAAPQEIRDFHHRCHSSRVGGLLLDPPAQRTAPGACGASDNCARPARRNRTPRPPHQTGARPGAGTPRGAPAGRSAATRCRPDRGRRRCCAGLVDDARTVEGSDGLSIGRGGLIQTRRNDAEVGVANRQTWIVQHVGTDGDLWVRDAASDRKQQRTMHLPAEYVAEHAHLAYAATAYGVQGITAPESHTILSDALDAAGVYVGLTRGREANRLHVVAADLGDGRGQFTAVLERDRADRGLREATERAKLAVAGVVADGPVREVNDERVRLAERIEDAEKRAAWWSDAAARLDRQAAEHGDAYDAQQAQLAAAREQMEAVRAAVVAPLVEAATADAATLMDAKDQEREADAARRAAGRLRRRGAERIRIAAEQDRTVIETAVRDRWGWAPSSAERVPAWAEAVAGRHADADPQVASRLAKQPSALSTTPAGSRHGR